ncbi:MAG: copper chaperone PCu(A)C [Devosia sp.]
MFNLFVRAALAGAIFTALALPALAHHGVMHDGCAPGQSFAIGAITVTGAFTREMLPGAEIAGGYMSIANSGGAPDRLVSVKTEAAKQSGLHQMTLEGDVMKMAPLEGGLEIPAGGSAVLEPGGNHVMMEGIDQSFEEGECVRIVLHFENAGELAVDLSVGGVSQDVAPTGHDMAGMAMHTSAITLGDLEITGPFTRATLPNAPVGAGFMVITNHGSADDRLVSASSPVAGITQIHEMKMEGDLMKMAELPDGLVIPARQSVTLAPGGFHVMFMDLKQPIVEGTTIPVTLTFENAGSIEVQLAVGPIDADGPSHDMVGM